MEEGMRQSRARSMTATAGTPVLGGALALLLGAAHLGAEDRTSGTEHWEGKEIRYELSGEAEPDIQFSKTARECRITVTIDGRERMVTLRDNDIDIDSEHLDVGTYARVSLNAERDFLIANLVTTRSWSSSASASESSQATSGSRTTSSEKSSRSESSGKSTDFHALGFTELNDMPIRVRLKGGRSAECSIAAGPDQRVIRFDVDGGKNEGTITIQPGTVSIDGVTKTFDRAARLLVTATKGSLKVTSDNTEIWSRD
jgi:hypothetical protein